MSSKDRHRRAELLERHQNGIAIYCHNFGEKIVSVFSEYSSEIVTTVRKQQLNNVSIQVYITNFLLKKLKFRRDYVFHLRLIRLHFDLE